MNASAQSFDYFAHNPRWVESYYQEFRNNVEVELYIEGDSLHNGELYHKLWVSRAIPYFDGDSRTGFPKIHGLIRQDGYKVWYKGFLTKYDPSNHQPVPLTDSDTFPDEFLLFDFGMQEGDTLFAKDLPTIGPEYDDDFFVLGFVDSVEYFRALPNSHARMMFFGGENGSNEILENHYEGIGTDVSFLGSPLQSGETGPGSSHSLTCYNNDSTQFVDPNFRYGPSFNDCNGVIESVHGIELSTESIYPKPSTGRLYFRDSKPTEVKVFNAMGQFVFSETNQAGIPSIDLKNHPQGLYTVQYQMEDEMYLEKILLE
jgi:hypothetical protein